MSDNSSNFSPEMVADTAHKLARQQIIGQGALMEANGSKVYAVPKGWENAQLKQDAEVTICTDLPSLDTALENPSAHTLFVPHDTGLNLAAIRQALLRTSEERTVFIESGN